MIAVILMVIGGIMAVSGFLGLFALMVEPLYTMYMVIFKREDDYVYYETKPGKALLQRNKNALRNSCIFLLVVGIICFGIGWFLRFGPRGTDSLFSEQVESGTNVGDEEGKQLDKQVVNAKGNYVDAMGEEHMYYVIVKGTGIKFRKEFEGSLEEFTEYIEKMDSKKEIYLVDDFAAAYTYHKVQALLEQYGFRYQQEGEGRE